MVRIPMLMGAIERSNRILNWSGKEKKTHLMDVLIKWSQSRDNEEIQYFVKNVVPPLIDTLILVDRKELSIKIKKCISRCW